MSVADTHSDCKAGSAWRDRADELVRWVWDRLVVRTDVWGGYNALADREKIITPADEKRKPYKLGATLTRPAKRLRGKVSLTPGVVRLHFCPRSEKDVIGLHTTSTKNESKWGTIEVDNHAEESTPAEVNERAALGWYGELKGRGFHPLLTDSNGRGGFHLDILLADIIPTPRLYYYLKTLTDGYAGYGLAARPESFPKQSKIEPGKYGNWVRVPGRHHTREHWSRVWDGSLWLEGHPAIDYLLSLQGDPSSLIPADAEISYRVGKYMAKLPHLAEGQGRDDIAFNLLAWLARDMQLPDPDCLRYAEEWDRGNTPPKGGERLELILANVHEHGQRAYGSGMNPPPNGHAPPPGSRPVEPFEQTPEEQPVEAEDDPHRLARLYLVDHTKDGLPTVRYWREEWQQWQANAYRRLSDKELQAELCARVKQEFDRLNVEALKAWRQQSEGEGEEGEKKKARPMPTARQVTGNKLRDVRQAFASMSVLPASTDQPSWLGEAVQGWEATDVLSCTNGLVHLPSAARDEDCIQPSTPRFFSPNALDYAYSSEPPAPARWHSFLSQVWPGDAESLRTLQEAFGYLLTPDTSQQKILMLVGPKRSGKGTIARVLTRVVGAANVCNPTLAGLGTNFGLSPLLGKTVAIISDARLSGRTDTAVVVERLLSISGEDGITVDRKHLSHVTAKLPVRFLVISNELPRLNDPSGALVGRLIVLRLTQSWYGKEDTALTSKLGAELPGILRWAIHGWARLRERGHFVQPRSGAQLVREMEDLSSPIGAFLRERCVICPGAKTPCRDLFDLWRRWCDEKGRREPGNEQSFGRDLRAAMPALGVSRPRDGDRRYRQYDGIRERRDNDPEPDD